MRKRYPFLVLVVACVGCAGLEGGTFDEAGYRHSDLPYKVAAGDGGRLLPREWRIDNFQLDDDGAPTNSLKRGPDYEADLRIDTNGDGLFNATVRYPVFDLRYLNTRNRGRIWLRSLPISWEYDAMDLRVLMREYVDSMAGAGLIVVGIGSEGALDIQVNLNRYATKMLAHGTAKIDGQSAFGSVIDIANVDQLELSPESRRERAEVFLIRTDYLWVHRGKVSPLLLLAGYSNLPEDFESGRKDFRNFVEHVRLPAPPRPPESVQKAIWGCVDELGNSGTTSSVRLAYQASKATSNSRFEVMSPDLAHEEISCARKRTKNSGKPRYHESHSYLITREKARRRAKTVLPRLSIDAERVGNSSARDAVLR